MTDFADHTICLIQGIKSAFHKERFVKPDNQGDTECSRIYLESNLLNKWKQQMFYISTQNQGFLTLAEG